MKMMRGVRKMVQSITHHHPARTGYVDADIVLIEQANHVVLDNGIVRVTISKPGGIVTGINYGGIDNVLEYRNKETNRGYWDLNWSVPGGKDNFDVYFPTHVNLNLRVLAIETQEKLSFEPASVFAGRVVVYGTTYTVAYKDTNRVEVSFVRLYNPSAGTGVPLNIDKRFVLLRGSSGFYSYAIYERPDGWPAFNINQTRITFKLSNDRFHYMAVGDDMQRLMPQPADLMPDRSEQLAYPEAHRLTNPLDPTLLGEVDDKYQYSKDNRELRVHGWVSADPLVGFWIITPSDEFRNGGPTKQNLTSHVGPTSLAMFHSAHYAGIELCPGFQEGEAWQKVFGPVFIYLNSAPPGTPYFALWQNATAQVATEMSLWPYSWPVSPDYPKAEERGTLSGRLMVSDPFSPPYIWGGMCAFLGLAVPGETGSWQKESKGYQFWTQADADGLFSIQNVRAGIYDLYGWIPGVLGDYKYEEGPIEIHAGAMMDIGEIVYSSPRDGPTVWDIGIPDRTATGFYVPDPNPLYINKLYLNSMHKWRQYGLWEQYTKMYPTEDLVFIVGQSDWRTDWFFAQFNRIMPDGSYAPTTWQVQFELNKVSTTGVYKLRIATAASSTAAIQVYVNNPSVYKPVFDTMQYGKDNAIARHGCHGLYKLWNIDINPSLLTIGQNTIYLKQRKAIGPFTGVMYDYLRFEAPSDSSQGSSSS